MDVKQSKVSAFFIDNSEEQESLAYIDKNAPLLKSYLLVFGETLSDALEKRCEDWGLCYVHNQGQLKFSKNKSQAVESKDAKLPTQSSAKEAFVAKHEQIFRTIRSGETLVCSGNLLVSGNVNDGAIVTSEGTMSIFGIICGNIVCNGSYLIVSTYTRGKVIFAGQEVHEMLQGSELKMLYKDADEIKIKELT